MHKIIRKSFLAAALTAAVCSVGSRFVVAADEKMSGDHMKMAGEQMDKMKMMAADQAQAHEMAAEMARLMVMDHMAMQIAMDPKFKQMSMQSMSDPNMKMVHDDAKKMADDPALMAKMQQEIMSDPRDMRFVMHMAHTMTMMHDGMMHDGMMHDDKMKDAKMKDMPAEKK
jgi:hypothetical protein